MPHFSFTTVWHIEAPIEAVWEALLHSERWPSWWKYVAEVIDLEPGSVGGVGSVRRYKWKTALPYTLEFDMCTTVVEPPFVLEGMASGEVEGRGRWHLNAVGNVTQARYDWHVRMNKGWMNWMARIARPVFKWNHDTVMHEGAHGLARLLRARVLATES